MPAIIMEKDMFVDFDNAAWAVPVNTLGVMGAGLAKHIKDKHPIVYHHYKEACANDKLMEQGYLHAMDLNSDFVCIITKHDWRDDSKYEYIINSLLRFDEDMLMNKEGMFGHLIEEIQLPALGCGKGNLIWEEIEDRLVEELKDTQTKFIFCIESWRRPHRFMETYRKDSYYFKGDTPLGLNGNYPFTLDGKEYRNAFDYIMAELTTGMEIKDTREDALRSHVRAFGLSLPNGRLYRDVLIESCYEAKKAQYEQIPALKEKLDQLRKYYIAYTGQTFARLLATGFQHHELSQVKDDSETWHGENILGDILMSF